MARPYLDRLSPQNSGSSMPSQMSSPANRAWTVSTEETSYPSSLTSDDSKTRFGLISPQLGPAFTFAKPPRSGTLPVTRPPSSHGKLHKRGNSVSSTQSPLTVTSPSLENQYSSNRAIQDMFNAPTFHEDHYSSTSPSPISKSKAKIKPFLLRKLSGQDVNSVDLSRSAAENEGLGIYTSSEPNRAHTSTDPHHTYSGKISHHTRATSGNSQISTITTSSNHRSNTQYVHPMRQTPRPYTPPLAYSHQHSFTTSEIAPAGPGTFQSHQYDLNSPQHSNQPQQYAPIPQTRHIPPPLHIRTISASRITSPSQTNLPGTPSSLRQQFDPITTTNNTPSTMSPTARSSLESSFYKRTRTTTPTSAPIDPVTQAQTVQALRQQFNEKQAAKDLKFQQAEARTREKEAKRQARRDEDERRKSEGKDRKRSKSLGASEKVGHFSRDHLSPQLGVTEIRTVEDAGVEERVPRRRRTETAGSASKAVRSQWMLFWFRFKTMWLKVKRKMSLSSSSH